MNDDLEELLSAGKLSKVRSWYKKTGLRVQTHRDNSIPGLIFTRHLLLCNENTYHDTILFGEIPLLLGFSFQLVAGWRSQLDRIFAWMRYINLVISMSRGS